MTRGVRRRRSRSRLCSRPSPSSGWSWSGGRPAGGFRRRRCSVTRPTATTRRCVGVCTTPDRSTCSRSVWPPRCSRPRPCLTFLIRPAGSGRPKSRQRPDRKPEAISDLIARVGSERVPHGQLPRRPRRETDPVAVRVRARQGRAQLREGDARPAPRGVADRRMARSGSPSRPTTGSRTCPPTPSQNGSPGSPGCAGKSSSTTSSSRASSASTTTKADAGSAGTTTPRSSPPPTASSPWSAYARKPCGWPDTPPDGAAPPARLQVLGQPLPNLPPTRRPQPARPLPPTGVTKHC